MDWLRLTITSHSQYIEPLSELLENFGAISLSYIPGSSEPVFADEADGTLWERTSIQALLNKDTDLDILLACIRNRIGTDHILAHQIEVITGGDWSICHQSRHGAMVYGDKLCVYPSWCKTPENIPYLVQLDPGLAFGTGSHPTTALCLEWLAGAGLVKKRVIDYGCGSGILALAAASMWAAWVHAVDVDPQALLATHRNAGNNQLTDRITITVPEQLQSKPVDILLANILLNPLLSLAEVFAGLVRPGGSLVLSGLLSVQADECLAAYDRWFMMSDPVFREEWAMLTGVRISDDHF